jgi:hypothetical protein
MEDSMEQHELRRTWLQKSLLLAATGGVTMTAPGLFGQEKKKAGDKGGEDEDVSPAEDLMREHGVLKRVLLIYREVMNRIESKRDFPPDVVMGSATLIRAFVEDYHEKIEEDYLFPRFKKANKLVDLTDVLLQQHQKAECSQIGHATRDGGSAERPLPACHIARSTESVRPDV